MLFVAAAYALWVGLFCIAWLVLDVLGKWFMFMKMGEPGWKSIIPIYSEYTIYKNVWQPVYFLAFVIVSCIGSYMSMSDGSAFSYIANLCGCAAFVITFLENIKLSRSFGHGYLFALGLLIFNPIFTMILGLGSSMYYGNFSEGN